MVPMVQWQSSERNNKINAWLHLSKIMLNCLDIIYNVSRFPAVIWRKLTNNAYRSSRIVFSTVLRFRPNSTFTSRILRMPTWRHIRLRYLVTIANNTTCGEDFPNKVITVKYLRFFIRYHNFWTFSLILVFPYKRNYQK